MEKPEIKSITIYINSRDFESFTQGNYAKVDWETSIEAFQPQFNGELKQSTQVNISLDTYTILTDTREQLRLEWEKSQSEEVNEKDLPF